MTADQLAQGVDASERVGSASGAAGLPAPTSLSVCDRLLDEVGRRGHVFAWLSRPVAWGC